MKRTRLAVAALSVIALASALAGCSTDAPTSANGSTSDYYKGFTYPKVKPEEGVSTPVDTAKFKKPDGTPLVVGYADSSLGNSWRVMVKAEVQYGISQVPGAKLVYTNANDSTTKQIADIDDLITQQVSVIVVGATDTKALCPSMAKAQSAGIPVIVLERSVDCPDDYTTFASLNAYEEAHYQMAYVAWRLGGKGTIAIVTGIAGEGHSATMEQGYNEVLKQYPGIKVVSTQYSGYDPTKAQQETAAILTAHPDVDAIVGISGNLGVGVFNAVQAAGKVSQMKAWVGDDANGWMLAQKNNDLPSLTVPYNVSIGADSIQLAQKILKGEPVMKTTEIKRSVDPIEFSKNIAKYANPDRPDEWWYNDMPCDFDPFCKAK